MQNRYSYVCSFLYILAGLTILFPSAALPAQESAKKITSKGYNYFIAPTPAWVMPIKSRTTPIQASTGAIMHPLLDYQTNLLETQPVTYIHNQILVQEKPGLEIASQINIEFNPTYQTLTLHALNIIRKGKKLDRLKTARIELLQRETQLDQLIYDGEINALIVVPDVRVGDIVDFAYSIRGSNPIFGSKFSNYYPLSAQSPIANMNVRILYPQNRNLQYKVFRFDQPATTRTVKNYTELDWAGQDIPAFKPEDGIPFWYAAFPVLQVTEYQNWGEVENWAADVYRPTMTDLDANVLAVVADIQKRAKSDEEKTMLALAFTQNEIRYFGVEIGVSSHKPNHPSQTLAQRFGDCKDKTVFLVVLLKQMGIDAKPALVSYGTHRGIVDWLPTPTDFDHVITQAIINGKTYWLDATRSLQGTTLENLGFEFYGKALVVGAHDPSGLSDVVAPADYYPHIEYVDEFSTENYDGKYDLVSTSKFYGIYAENARITFRSQPLDQLSNAFATDVARRFPNLEVTAPLATSDDTENNVFTVTGHYRILDFLSYEDGRIKFKASPSIPFITLLQPPQDIQRKFPLALPYPITISSKQIIHFPQDITLGSVDPASIWDAHFAYTMQNNTQRRQATFDFELHTLSDAITPSDMPMYMQNLMRVRNESAFAGKFSAYDKDRVLPDLKKIRVPRDQDHLDKMATDAKIHLIMGNDAISHTNLSGKLLAQAYHDRSIAHDMLGEHENALADIDRALAIDANDTAWYTDRGVSLLTLGRYVEALDSFQKKQAPDSNDFLLLREGYTNYLLGNYGNAADQFQMVLKDANFEDSNYALIWLYLNALRQNQDGKSLITRYRNRTDLNTWPGPIVRYFLGEISADDLIDTASKDKNEARLQLTEAYFYLGEQQFIAKNTDTARSDFNNAMKQEATMYIESDFAHAELSHLH